MFVISPVTLFPAIKTTKGLQLVLSIQNHVLMISHIFGLTGKDIKYCNRFIFITTTQTDIKVRENHLLFFSQWT